MNEPSNESIDSRPWYRHHWPWLVMIPPAASVVAGFGLLFAAISSPNPLVVDDYAAIARHTEKRMERDREAARLALSARATIHEPEEGHTGRLVEVTVDSPHERLDVTLALTLSHPTLARHDRHVLLRYDGDAYRGVVEDLVPGRYYLQLAPEQRGWRLTGELRTTRPIVEMRPVDDAHVPQATTSSAAR